MSGRSRFRTPFGSQRINGSQSLVKSASPYFNTIVPSFWDKLGCQKMLLVRFETLAIFLNIMTTDDEICRYNRDDFAQQIQMQLSQQLKQISLFFLVL